MDLRGGNLCMVLRIYIAVGGCITACSLGSADDLWVLHDEMAQSRGVFEEIDGNHDNHISYIEFINW